MTKTPMRQTEQPAPPKQAAAKAAPTKTAPKPAPARRATERGPAADFVDVQPAPGGVTVTVCTDRAHHADERPEGETCPNDHTETWGRTTPDEPDADFARRIKREMLALVSSRTQTATLPKALQALVPDWSSSASA